MVLSDRPKKAELLIWCDYLEESGLYPEEATSWLRQAVQEGLRPWTLVRTVCWDTIILSSYARMLRLALGELPWLLWTQLSNDQVFHCPMSGYDVKRRCYENRHQAWLDILQALTRLVQRGELAQLVLPDCIDPMSRPTEAQEAEEEEGA
jgi:hypothetical protein